MKLLVRVLICCVLATGAWAQRGGGSRGGGGHSGGFSGGGFHGGGISHGGGFSGGGFRGGGISGFRGGYYGGRGFYGRGFGLGFGLGYYGGYWPGYGYGYYDPYWYGGYGYPYYSSYYSYPYYDTSSYYDPGYYSNTNVSAYPQTQYAPPVASQPARPAIHEYRDEYGQSREITYLIAFKDGTIRAAVSYWADGNTLHYVTREKQERTTPLDAVDRAFSEKLNHDQRVQFHLP